MIRVAAFVDGFNLYHAVDDLAHQHYKWLDIKKVLGEFIDPKLHQLAGVYYFSAYATWLPDAHKRHEAFVKALVHTGVTAILGKFKNKPKWCNACGAGWTGHEEKESDVNLALAITRGAYRDEYDEAFLVTGDSDIAPAVRMVQADFPKKKFKLVTPPGRRHSKELGSLANKLVRIKEFHLQRCLLPASIVEASGTVIVTRPPKYDPPPPPEPAAPASTTTP